MKIRLEDDGSINLPASVIEEMDWRCGDILTLDVTHGGDLLIHGGGSYVVKKVTYDGRTDKSRG